MWINIVPSDTIFVNNLNILEGALNMSGSIQRLEEAISQSTKNPTKMKSW